MKRISCLVIEDEPASQEILRKYITDFPRLACKGYCTSAFEAAEALRIESVDVLFLDINLPRLSGMEFYRSLNDPPPVIFTTAYPEYAIEGFEVNAVDYLVKPISFERFVRAVNRYLDSRASSPFAESYLTLMVDKKMHKVDFDSILFVEGMGDYVKVHTIKTTLIVLTTLHKLQEQLPAMDFPRIHKSYMISFAKLEYVEGNRAIVANHQVPIGQTYRSDFLTMLQNRGKEGTSI